MATSHGYGVIQASNLHALSDPREGAEFRENESGAKEHLVFLSFRVMI